MAKTKEHWNENRPKKRNTKNLEYSAHRSTRTPRRRATPRWSGTRFGSVVAFWRKTYCRRQVATKSSPFDSTPNAFDFFLCGRFLILSLFRYVYTCDALVRVCGGVWSRLLLLLLSKSSSLFRVASSFPVVFFWRLFLSLSLSLSLYKFISIFPIVFKRGVATNCLGFRVWRI